MSKKTVKEEYERASGNTVKGDKVFDSGGHYITDYDYSMAELYPQALDDDDDDDSIEDSEGRMMAGMAHGNKGLAEYHGLETDRPDGTGCYGCGGRGCEDCNWGEP